LCSLLSSQGLQLPHQLLASGAPRWEQWWGAPVATHLQVSVLCKKQWEANRVECIMLSKVTACTDLKEEVIAVVAHIGYAYLLANAFQVLLGFWLKTWMSLTF